MTLNEGSPTVSTNSVKQSSQILVETILTEARHFFLTLTWLIQCISFHPTPLINFHINLCSVLRFLQVVSFRQVFPPVPVWTSPLPCMFHMPRPSDSPWVDHLNNILWGVQNNEVQHSGISSDLLVLPASYVNVFS